MTVNENAQSDGPLKEKSIREKVEWRQGQRSTDSTGPQSRNRCSTNAFLGGNQRFTFGGMIIPSHRTVAAGRI